MAVTIAAREKDVSEYVLLEDGSKFQVNHKGFTSLGVVYIPPPPPSPGSPPQWA